MKTSIIPAFVITAMAFSATAHAQTTYYVSLTGKDTNPGTLQLPFRTVQRGVNALQAPGDVLELRGGDYVGAVLIENKNGTVNQPIVIRSYPGERARIDGYLPLSTPGPTKPLWEPALLHDPAAHPDEFVSTRTFAEASVNRGAFLEKGSSYTRLVAYSRLEDLRALNETFEKIDDPADPRPAAPVMVQCAAGDPNPACQPYPDCSPYPACVPTPPRRYKPAGYGLPWVYMGPGLWFNETTRKVHARLSPTHNAVPGLKDYSGATDPNQITLAVTGRHMVTLQIKRSSYLFISGIDVRFGGDQTMWLREVADVTFDRVNVWAGARGVRTSAATRTTFRNASFDGGVPGWLFRSDLKDVHWFLADGRVEWNGLAAQTVDSFTASDGGDSGTLIEYSEFVNGHDLYLAGAGVRFHHNWVRNLNDDCLFMDAPGYGVSDALVYQNVFEQCLSAINMAGEEVGGPKYVYRNLIDSRLPTAGFRPFNAIDRGVWRYGHPFKLRREDGVLAVFQNTFLVNPRHTPEDSVQAAFLHYRDTPVGGASRRSFNNIFFVNQNVASDTAITFLPDPGFSGPTDGNAYFRFGAPSSFAAPAKPFRILGYCLPGPCPPGQPATYLGREFATLAELRQSQYFQHSKGVYAPGFEANSTEEDPWFESLSADGSPRASDDFRLSEWSHLRNAGISLPKDLLKLDALVMPGVPRDIGCCPHGSAPLEVGVDGRRMFPNLSGSGDGASRQHDRRSRRWISPAAPHASVATLPVARTPS